MHLNHAHNQQFARAIRNVHMAMQKGRQRQYALHTSLAKIEVLRKHCRQSNAKPGRPPLRVVLLPSLVFPLGAPSSAGPTTVQCVFPPFLPCVLHVGSSRIQCRHVSVEGSSVPLHCPQGRHQRLGVSHLCNNHPACPGQLVPFSVNLLEISCSKRDVHKTARARGGKF